MAKTITELTTAGAVTPAVDLLWLEQGGLPFKITPDALGIGGGISPPIVLLDTEEIQFGTGTDATIQFDGTNLVIDGKGLAAETYFQNFTGDIEFRDGSGIILRSTDNVRWVSLTHNGTQPVFDTNTVSNAPYLFVDGPVSAQFTGAPSQFHSLEVGRAGVKSVTMADDGAGTSLDISQGTGITQIVLTDLDLWIEAGNFITIFNAGNTTQMAFANLGTVGQINTVGLDTVRFENVAVEIEERATSPTQTAAYGMFWVRSDVPNTPMFKGDSGVESAIAQIAKDEVVTGAWEFHHATFGAFAIDRLSTTGGSAIRYRNDDGIKGYAGFNDAGSFETYTSGAASSGFTVLAAGDIHLNDSTELQLGNLSGGDAQIYFDGADTRIDCVGTANDFRLRVNTTEQALVARPNSSVGLFYNNVEEFQTQDSNGTDNITGANVKHWDGNFYDVGLARMPEVAFTANLVVSDTHWHKSLVHTNATTHTLTFNTETTQPQDVVMWVKARTGIVTITQGTMTLTWYDGSGTLKTGTRTLAIGGWATIVKTGDSTADLTGVGLT